jgi:hypothetical protein
MSTTPGPTGFRNSNNPDSGSAGSNGSLAIRGHTLLCLQGFRGEGYSPDFIRNMTEIHRRLAEDPALVVTVVDSPDAVCRACPHLSAEGCRLNGPGSEGEMKAQDGEVLRRLGLEKGKGYPWGEILDRIGRRIVPPDLDDICGDCRWLPLGYCKEGIRRL